MYTKPYYHVTSTLKNSGNRRTYLMSIKTLETDCAMWRTTVQNMFQVSEYATKIVAHSAWLNLARVSANPVSP